MSVQDGYEQVGQFFRVLSHPVRLHILDLLAQQEACVCHLTAILDRPQPYVSQQLAALRDAGLVVDRREGTLVYYRLAGQWVDTLLELSKILLQRREEGRLSFPPLPQEELANCPCPRCSGTG